MLSATLASGITQAGWRSEQPLALDDRFAPPVAPRDAAKDRKAALPMDRMPATAGLDLVSVGTRRRNPSEVSAFFARLFGGTAHSLEHEFGGAVDISAPWHDVAPDERIETDIAIVGGGVAGMRAAIAAASTGETRRPPRAPPGPRRRRALLRLDRRRGSARRRSSTASPKSSRRSRASPCSSAPRPSASTAARSARTRSSPATSPPAASSPSPPSASSSRTGSFERLPVFPGNRAPGVTRAVAAFNLADRFGVWIGHKALFNTASGFAYRLAVEAQKAGLAVERIADTRMLPQSRFIDFSKAYGVPLSYRRLAARGVPGAARELEVRLTEAAPDAASRRS